MIQPKNKARWQASHLGRPGLTLIELLAASALAALMTVAVSGMLGLLARQRRELAESQPTEPWRRRFIDRLQWDFGNARQYRCNGDELMLSGFGAREFDFASRRPTHRPALVSYRVRTIGNRSWLVRRETHLDERTLVNWRCELVCADVDRIELQPIGAVGDAAADRSIPRQAKLQLRSSLTGEAAIDATLRMY